MSTLLRRLALSIGALLTLEGLATSCLAQPYLGTATFRWEGSADGGVTWHSGELVVPSDQTGVHMRAVVSWSQPAVRFVAAFFDVAITGEEGSADTADSFAFHPRYNHTNIQSITTTRFGNVLKIDVASDTMPPGEGPGALAIHSDELSVFPPFDHPVEIFRFRLVLDGAAGPRTVHEYFYTGSRYPDMNRTNRVVVLSGSTDQGGYMLPNTTREPLTIHVLCPSDFTQDGQLDFFDYLDFIQAFADGDPRADFNRDGEIDFFDYLDFVEAFVAGC